MGFFNSLKQSNSPFKRGLKAISSRDFNMAFEIAADNYGVGGGEDSLKLSDELKKHDFPVKHLLFLESFIHMHSKNPKKALESFDEFLSIDSHNPYVLYNKMEILYGLKEFRKAFECGNFILDNFNNLDWDYEIAGYFKESKVSKKVIRANSVFVAVSSLINAGEYERALKILDGLIELDAYNPSLFNLKYMVCSEMRDYESALYFINKAIYLDEDKNLFLFNKGNVLAKLNRHEEAIECFNKALALGTPETIILYFKAVSFMELGQYDKAKGNFKRLTDLLGSSDMKSGDLGEIYEKSIHYLRTLEDI